MQEFDELSVLTSVFDFRVGSSIHVFLMLMLRDTFAIACSATTLAWWYEELKDGGLRSSGRLDATEGIRQA